MGIRHFHSALVTLDNTAQNLATELQMKPGKSRVYRLDLQPGAANASPSYYGDATVATTGIRMEAADSGVPPAPAIWEVYQTGLLDLADVYVIGAENETLRVCWVQYTN